ncbi:MAG: SDR family oxidoreductase, partial [Alphaproteobacteria bacterium]|nr:SDR family oxidoreductase [Alphaproteobacteria bacterium]
MTEPTGLMAGKRGLIMGVANERSLAWGISRALHAHGAELAFTYQGEALEKRLRPLAESIGSDIIMPCDVTDEDSIDATFAALEEKWGTIDFVVHAIGFSDKDELKGRYVDTSRQNFLMSMDISCYSFTSICRR